MAHGFRLQLLEYAARFVGEASRIPGVRSISLIGSIVTEKADPKDIDLVVLIDDAADLERLAAAGRRLKGRAQGLNRGADVFLANTRGTYLGRTCHWKNCWPGARISCDALHCGRRPYLHDDFATVRLSRETIRSAPVRLWPTIERRGPIPADLETFLARLEQSL